MLSSWRTAGAASLLLAAALPLADAFSLAPSLQSRLAPPSALRSVARSPLLPAAAPLRQAVLPRSRKTRTPSGALALTASSAIPPKNLEPSDPVGFDASVLNLAAQLKRLIKCAPSLFALMLLNHVTVKGFALLAIKNVPPPLFGMFAMFALLLALPEKIADQVTKFFSPGVNLLGKFLPLFYTPALVAVPLSARVLATPDVIKLFSIVSVVVVLSYVTTAYVTVFLQSLSSSNTEAPKEAGYNLGFSSLLLKTWGTLMVASLGVASVAPSTASAFAFMTATTLFCFIAGIKLGVRLPAAVNKAWHPLMSSFVMVNICFVGYGAMSGQALFDILGAYIIPGAPYLAAPGNAIMYWLAPAIWSFAFGLYQRRKTLFPNWLPIMGGSFWSAVSGILFIALMARLLDPVESLKLALLPRGTAALAVVQASCIGAATSLVTAAVVITGMLGANFGQSILNGLGIKSNCARGVSTGGAAMTLGTAALAKDDPNAFPFGALGMALMSTWATVLYSIPIFSTTVLDIAGVQARTGSAVVHSTPKAKSPPKALKAGRQIAFVTPGQVSDKTPAEKAAAPAAEAKDTDETKTPPKQGGLELFGL